VRVGRFPRACALSLTALTATAALLTAALLTAAALLSGSLLPPAWLRLGTTLRIAAARLSPARLIALPAARLLAGTALTTLVRLRATIGTAVGTALLEWVVAFVSSFVGHNISHVGIDPPHLYQERFQRGLNLRREITGTSLT
jgi:hypothetical protein